MKTIWKFPVPITDTTQVKVPRWSKILHFGEQDGRLFMWAQVDTDHEATDHEATDRVTLHVYGTGEPMLEVHEGKDWKHKHLSTVVMANGEVWHIFGTRSS